jgi:hypothetical protein
MAGRKTDIGRPRAAGVATRDEDGGGGDVAPKRTRGKQPNVVKRGLLATLVTVLRPIALSVALIIGAYGVVTLATNYWRSYLRHVEHSKATHDDRSIIDVLLKPQLGGDRVDLVIRDVDGKVRQVVASQSETDRFVNETILMLDDERDQIKQAAYADIDEIFANAFADKQESIDAYADWFFEWKRSYIVLKETLTSAANRFIQAGEYQSMSEAVENDVQDYFMRHYQEQVLKPEVRDHKISGGLDQVVRRAHESYRRVIANGDLRLQLFLARHTSSLKEVPADQAVTTVALDWDAQKWKAPTYLMEDRAFDGIAGVGKAAAAGTVGALVLGPVINRVMARSFGMLSRRFATSLGTRLALAQKGAVAGTLVQPAGGTAVGAVAGVMIGIAADYFINEADEAFNRDKFVVANGEALEATIELWRGKVKANVGSAIDRWFDDARSGVVLAEN